MRGSKFTLEHAWCVLRYEQKWLNLNSAKASESSNKRKTVESDSQTSTTSVGEEEIRPEGVKAAKAKRDANGKSVDYYTTVLELRKFSDYKWVLITAIHNLHKMRCLVGQRRTVSTMKSNLSFSKTKLSYTKLSFTNRKLSFSKTKPMRLCTLRSRRLNSDFHRYATVGMNRR
ncbi:hypothetical protein F2Q69_00010424 [Brassica cretica]|uniref:No apical meristem-associated C-terminal domain-containing protein n=1 Tax=Brassica cretica TaxID=69181 RepID=A0A8S9R2L7_BRACR|nr:hypothetical protein F2Q69_00010424 [Brassica cretica]